MDEPRTEHARGHEPPPRWEGWPRDEPDPARVRGHANGYAGGRGVPDLSPLIAIFEALRRAVPHELQEQFAALQRELLLTLRALIDWYLERLDKPELEPQVEDIPID
jgi:hypothetical protein